MIHGWFHACITQTTSVNILLFSKMWKGLKNSNYFLLFNKENGFEIYVTDYVSIWFANYSSTSFLNCLKKSNDGLEFVNEDDFIQKGTRMLLNPDQLKKLFITEVTEDTLSISMTVSYGYSFKLECILTKGSKQLKITQQLLSTIKDLRSSETELRHLMKRKDDEIEEYKCEGGKIALRCLKTAIYNDDTHMSGHKVYENFFGQSVIPKGLLEKEVNVTLTSNVKDEPTEDNSNQVKTELNDVKREFEMEALPETTQSITAAVNVKEEVKTEIHPNLFRLRKRAKRGLNY